MKGVHDGDEWVEARYRHGQIVRRYEEWGVVIGAVGYWTFYPHILWWRDGKWVEEATHTKTQQAISAPYTHTYEGIPDEVLAKATQVMLLGDDI